jgi:hypothetical protein
VRLATPGFEQRSGFVTAAAVAWIAGSLAAGLPDKLSESAGAHAAQPTPRVLVATSGNFSETRKAIPITRRPRADRRVVMSMSARRLPNLQTGDRLKLTAELQVTVDCREPGSSCAGRPYLFNPRVGSQLVLARGRGSTDGPNAKPVSRRRVTSCRGKPLSSRQHHCVIVFTRVSFDLHELGALPCRPASCRVNLVLDAHNRRARRGNKLVIGASKPSGRIVQDRGRINAIRLRPGAQPPPPVATSRRRRHHSIPLDETRTVILSKRLVRLRKGGQLEVLAGYRADVSRLPYSTRVTTHLILARSPRATETSPLVANMSSSFHGQIAEANGSNCTKVQTPCPYTKVGVLRMRRDARSRAGHRIPLYVNVYVVSNPKRARRRPGDRLAVLAHPKLKVARYKPSLLG